MIPEAVSWGYRGRSAKLTTHLQRISVLQIRGTIPQDHLLPSSSTQGLM